MRPAPILSTPASITSTPSRFSRAVTAPRSRACQHGVGEDGAADIRRLDGLGARHALQLLIAEDDEQHQVPRQQALDVLQHQFGAGGVGEVGEDDDDGAMLEFRRSCVSPRVKLVSAVE